MTECEGCIHYFDKACHAYISETDLPAKTNDGSCCWHQPDGSEGA